MDLQTLKTSSLSYSERRYRVRQLEYFDVPRAVSGALCMALGETGHDPRPRQCIRYLAKFCGSEYMQQFYARAIETQAKGGLMKLDGSGPRTLGGVFFYLVRKDLGYHLFHALIAEGDQRKRIKAARLAREANMARKAKKRAARAAAAEEAAKNTASAAIV